MCPLWRVKRAFFLFPTSRAAVQQICVSLIPNVIFQPFSHLLQTLAFASSGPTIKSDTGQHSQFLCWSNLLNLTNDCVCPESSMCSALKAQSSSSFSFISFCFEALCASDLHFKCISYSSFSSSWFNTWIQTHVVFKFKFNVSISLLYNFN